MTDNNIYKELDDLYDEDGNLRVESDGEPGIEEGATSASEASESAVESAGEDTSPRASHAPENGVEGPSLPALENGLASKEEESSSITGGATAASSPGEDGYFEDDEDFLRGDSRVLLSEKDGGVLENLENVVTWEVDNFYNEAGKQRGRISLRTDPPIFRIRSSDGDGAEFVLTKELAGDMERVMGDVYRGYFGITAKDKKDRNKLDQDGVRGFMDKVSAEAKEHPVRFAILALFLLACIFYLVIG